MDVVEIYVIYPHPGQAFVELGLEMGQIVAKTAGVVFIAGNAALGGDMHLGPLIGVGGQPCANGGFAAPHAVNIRGVDMVDPKLGRGIQNSVAVFFGGGAVKIGK